MAVLPKSINVDGGVFVDTLTGFLRLCDDAVFHVGNVHYVGDFVTFELQVTAQDVSCNGAAEVSDVAVVPDGWTTVIEAGLAFPHGPELVDVAG